MTIDTKTLPAGRETDKLVAEYLNWWNVCDLDGYLVGWPPPHSGDGDEEYESVPNYSTTDAALDALGQFQKIRGNPVILSVRVSNDERKWAANERLEDPGAGLYLEAPTLWLAVCRLICGTMGQPSLK